ncbi:polyketide synthase dehydratase domain-containing protein [Ideonella azotifigens]|nr:type I polyketide synthase [Ideonella azotifigens]MCD2343232.1 polyketide synthase dehydratase domain-containing protein [Ideonella azotifigens]
MTESTQGAAATGGISSKADVPAAVAIIGMACMYPQAGSMHAFWRNIIGGVDAITEPVESWDAQRYLDTGRIKTPFGGYLKDLYRFDPREFGIMPNSLDGGEPDQFLALKVAGDALRDAGGRYADPKYDHRDTGIVLGHSTYLHRGQGTLIQNHIVVDQTIEILRASCPHMTEEQIEAVRSMLAKKLPAASADIAPGLVPNVMTGRIANRLNLKGPNYLVDAACSSSLLAVNAAMDELRLGRSKLMLAGGVNASLPAEVSVIFTQLGALSGRGKVRPFEKGSDGTLLGEGLGIVALKLLDEALADGDRIYAVVRGVGQSSDGRGTGLLAPSMEGESLAMKRAYSDCGVDPSTISLIEAHGTGIPLGDKTEIGALKSIFGERTAEQGTIALGSVKSMISHTIPAAGMAGLIKSALALHHKVLPPMLCGEINPDLGIDQTPMYINNQTGPWIAPQGAPRRAGVNSFGFGGINTHAVLEEAPAAALSPQRFMPWSAELFVLSADSAEALKTRVAEVQALIEARHDLTLSDLAGTLAATDAQAACRLALVASDKASLSKQLTQAVKKLSDGNPNWSTRNGMVYSSQPMQGKLAFIFPGEGSQYPGMLGDLALCFDDVRNWLDFWCSLYPDQPGERRTDIAYPPSTGLSAERRAMLERRMNDMDVGSEAVFVGGQALNQLLGTLGVQPDVMLGHSSGESSALAASGAIPAATPQELAEFIRELNKVYRAELADGSIPTGALLAVGALPREQLDGFVAEAGAGVYVAMDNCANQVILYGSAEAMAALQAKLTQVGAICMMLPFDRGYHTPAFDTVTKAFLKYYRAIKLGAPRVPMYSCASANLFPEGTTALRQQAAAQWSTTVRFRETIQKMHDDGVRWFIEVGPSANLTAFVNDILAGREYTAIATNQRRRSGMEQLLSVLGQLWVHQKPVGLATLFNGRKLNTVELTDLTVPAPKGVLLDNTMPQMHLNEGERCRLRDLAALPSEAVPVAAPVLAALPPAVQAPVAAAVVPVEAPAPMEELSPLDSEVALRGQVMGEYFDVMRGFLEQQRAVMDRLPIESDWDESAEAVAAEQDPVAAAMGFLDEILEFDEEHLVARSALSLERDNFLRDHVLSGRVSADDPQLVGLSCVPLMVSLEIMAQAAAALAGSVNVCVIENVRAFDWIALDDGEIELKVQAKVMNREQQRFSALLSGPSGRLVSAEFRFAPVWQLPAASNLTEWRSSLWNDQELYTCGMFHGPVFHSIEHIHGWDDAGIDCALSPVSLDSFFTPGQQATLVLNPVLLDAMGQLAAFWIAQYVGTDFNCFPSTIDRIELYTPCPNAQPGMQLRARHYSLDASNNEVSAPRAWQFECLDASGQPLVRVNKLVNIFFSVPNRFYQVRRDPLNGWLGQPLAAGAEKGTLLWRLEHLPEDFCAQSGNIFLRILAHIYLSVEEREEWAALTGSVRRKREWLLGRACLKEAVRQWIQLQTGQLLYSSDILVGHDELGAPWVDGWWRDHLVPAPQVSLSHNEAGSLVAVNHPDAPVGVDAEQHGRIQNPELFATSLTAAERAALAALPADQQAGRLLALWCAKEAAAKCLGLGLQGQPEAFAVEFLDAAGLQARVSHAQALLAVTIYRDEGSLIALATESGDRVEVH